MYMNLCYIKRLAKNKVVAANAGIGMAQQGMAIQAGTDVKVSTLVWKTLYDIKPIKQGPPGY